MTRLLGRLKPIFRRIIPFIVVWTSFSIVYLLLERGIIGELDYYPATNNPYNFKLAFIYTTGGAFLASLSLGLLETFLLKSAFRKSSFIEKIILKSLIYLFTIIFFLITIAMVANSDMANLPLFHPQVIESLRVFVSNFSFISVTIYATVLAALSLFISDISDYVGNGVFLNFLLGRYNTPIQEDRIFLFLDMKSSTTHAENLGHVRYFNLLQDYYADMSKAIMAHDAEIYQYVGDEIILTWKRSKGLKEDACFKCFYGIKRALKRKEKKYRKKYGVMPTFKAGLHCGTVTSGEIGEIKKEILFTGDVINTTARIQELCNEVSSDFLVSADVVKGLSANIPLVSIGEYPIRGKNGGIELYKTLKQ